MKKRIMALALCMVLGTSLCTFAEEADTAPKPRIIATSDGVLSIEAPSDDWEVMQDPNHWFAMTDGTNTITIEHLSNGESLPAVAVADDTYAAVYQAFVSTRNEVFAVKGCSPKSEELESVMKAIARGEEALDSVNGTQDPSAPGQVYCIYCGQYYAEGNEFRNHICPRRDEAYAEYAVEPLEGTQDPLAGN